MECTKYRIQYIGKSETPFNLRLNNHRKDAKNPRRETIPACKHYVYGAHDFNKHAQFTLVDQIKAQNKTIERKRSILSQREHFSINKLKTIKPYGLNQDYN